MNAASEDGAATPRPNALRAVAAGTGWAVDLLGFRPLRGVVRWPGFPRAIQWLMLAAFVALILLAWGQGTPAGVNDKLFARSNLVTLIVWGLWWPAMVWLAFWFGRAWCMVCPLELVGDLGERTARAIGWRQGEVPRWMAGGSLILALFVALQLLVPGVHLHRVPAYTAWMLAGLLALALGAGLVYRHRAFCRGVCPVGLLLGTYGRGGMLAVRPAPAVAAGRAPGPDARACPSLLNPSRLESSADCLLCTHCFKESAPGAMRLELRRPYSPTDFRPLLAPWPVTGFVMVASGFVVSELCSEWAAAKNVFLAVPQWVTAQLGWPAGAGWVEGVWTVFVVPAVLWLVLALAWRLAGERGSWSDLWRRLALPVAIVVAAGHMSKGLAKFVSWLPFLPGAWRDPAGLETARAITAKTLRSPPSLVGLGLVGWISLGLVILALLVATREHVLTRRGAPGAMRVVWPLGTLAAGFLAILAGWR
jgi:hypothetical protein